MLPQTCVLLVFHLLFEDIAQRWHSIACLLTVSLHGSGFIFLIFRLNGQGDHFALLVDTHELGFDFIPYVIEGASIFDAITRNVRGAKVAFYTIGQRKGIGIGGIQGREGEPWYVAHKDMAKNTLVVMPDAVPMVPGAVTNILGSCFGAAGQRCLAGSILLTVGDVHSAVMDTLVTATRALTVGDGADPSVDVGPVVSAASRDRIMGNIDAGAASGATLLVDGRKPHLKAANTEGFFVGPTLFDHVAPENALAQTEIFGPVLSVDNVPNLDAAIDRINAGTFGNAASLYTGSGKAAREFRHRVVAGNIGINVGVAAAMAFFPFAGMKASFFGTLHGQGRDAVEFFTDKKIYIERWF